jgi:hypothetical protein
MLCDETVFAIKVSKLAKVFSHLRPWSETSWSDKKRPNWPVLVEDPEFVLFPDLCYFDGMKNEADSRSTKVDVEV